MRQDASDVLSDQSASRCRCGFAGTNVTAQALCGCCGKLVDEQSMRWLVERALAHQSGRAFEDFIAEVAAPTGRLRLTGNTEGDVLYAAVKKARLAFDEVESWCERCGRKHVMRGQVEPCAGCGGNTFVFRKPASDEGRDDA